MVARLGFFKKSAASILLGCALGSCGLNPAGGPRPTAVMKAAQQRHSAGTDVALVSVDPLFGPEAVTNVTNALRLEASPDPAHPYVIANMSVKRRLGQLGLNSQSPNLIYIEDISFAHGGQIARQICGKTGLIPQMAVRMDRLLYEHAERQYDDHLLELELEPADAVMPIQRTRGGIRDLIDGKATNALTNADHYVGLILSSIMQRTQPSRGTPARKIFVNVSMGYSLQEWGRDLAITMMTAPPGTQLFAEATRVLGHAPSNEIVNGGERIISESDPQVAADLALLERALIFPLIEAEITRPEYGKSAASVVARTQSLVADARARGIMVFKAAGNYQGAERRSGYPRKLPAAHHTAGIFVVGAIDDTSSGSVSIAPFSSAGNVTAAARGVDIPVGLVQADGNMSNTFGTSIAAPDLVVTAYYISAVAPHLNFDDIEAVLTDPRVTTDVPSTTRDGAGFVNQFRAILLAKYPHLTAQKMSDITKALDRKPETRFTVDAEGHAVEKE